MALLMKFRMLPDALIVAWMEKKTLFGTSSLVKAVV
jgi:hypothetical protein